MYGMFHVRALSYEGREAGSPHPSNALSHPGLELIVVLSIICLCRDVLGPLHCIECAQEAQRGLVGAAQGGAIIGKQNRHKAIPVCCQPC